MPTVWTNGNFAIIVRVRDEHPPPHVHVMDADNECLVEIGASGVRLYRDGKKRRCTERFKKKALKEVEKRLEDCRAKWRDKHGNEEL